MRASLRSSLLSRRRSPALAALVAASALGCGSSVEEPPKPPATEEPGWTRLAAPVEQLDLLLTIDNSRSMGDKQEILALALPELIDVLVNPPCVVAEYAADQVKVGSPTDPCPAGRVRLFRPVRDLHVGVISTSLGGHGGDLCDPTGPGGHSNDDRGHLLARSTPEQVNDLETFQGKGFLAWDPGQERGGSPGAPDPGDGEADLLVDSAADTNATALVPQIQDMVRGVGEVGCGLESQLESWYRFLVDPEPYETITVQDGAATLEGIDAALLQQRADFLRPGSSVAVVLLSDENDCSIHEGGQFYHVAQQFSPDGTSYRLPRARSECEQSPDDPCCKSCGQNAGSCPVDPTCYVNGDPAQGIALLDPLEDIINVRCFDQKRRFGIDFLYPVDRYIQALTSAVIPNRRGEIVQNPLFADLDTTDDDRSARRPEQVVFAGLVGVPWQDIARDAAEPALGFKNADAMRAPVGDLESAWEVVLGDPASGEGPADPFMIESIDPRSGDNPITGDPITPPGGPLNAINGSERTLDGRDALQYACTFPLPPGGERDCSAGVDPDCACEPGNDDPLCAPNPNDNGERTLQVRAGAYPSLRELAVVKGLGSQGVVGSVCPVQLEDPAAEDFGYRPAVASLLWGLGTSLADDDCLPRSLPADAMGRISCEVIEARRADGACTCDGPGRTPAPKGSPEEILETDEAKAAGWDCVCALEQLDGATLGACQGDVEEPVTLADGTAVHGYCYIDANTSPPTGNTALVGDCIPARRLRYAGQGEPQRGAGVFLRCDAE